MPDIEPANSENSFVSIFHYEGRDIPFEVVGPLPEEMDAFLDAFAEFIWKHRQLANKE
jgi:hypothetical protein